MRQKQRLEFYITVTHVAKHYWTVKCLSELELSDPTYPTQSHVGPYLSGDSGVVGPPGPKGDMGLKGDPGATGVGEKGEF